MLYALDTDGLIKLFKAGVLSAVVEAVDCVIPDAVYSEAVIKGREYLYPDADRIDLIISENIQRVRLSSTDLVLIDDWTSNSLRSGEREVLGLAYAHRAENPSMVIVSDDAAFLALVRRLGMIYMTPSAMIVQLAQLKLLDQRVAVRALHRMRPYIRQSVFEESLKDLGELQ